jgi:hypothetical protein
MGVYLCLGQPIHGLQHKDAIAYETLGSFEKIHQCVLENGGKIFVFLGEGTHKIKKKAEQIACERVDDVANGYTREARVSTGNLFSP